MDFLVRNLAVFHVFALCAAYAWLIGGKVHGIFVTAIPWFTLLVLVGLFFFPQPRHGEALPDARRRVWREVRGDGLSWTALALIVLLAIPFLNTGLCPTCDFAAIAAGADPRPPVSFLPFCVDRPAHLEVFLWFAPSLAAVVAARHALSKHGKRLLLELLVWNAVALAVLGFVQLATGAKGPLWAVWSKPARGYFFSVWGYANMAGSFFTLAVAAAFALWRWRAGAAAKGQQVSAGSKPGEGAVRRVLGAHYPLAAVAVVYAAALATLSRAAIVFSTAILALAGLHAFAGAFQRQARAVRLKMAVGAVAGGVALAFAVVCGTPSEVRREAGTLNANMMFERVNGKQYVPAAMRLWREHPLFGVGGWGYQHFCYFLLPKTIQRNIRDGWGIGLANVHDDTVQFLCEHGAAGLALLLAVVAMLLWPVAAAWRRFYNWSRFALPDRAPPKPYVLYCIPPPVFYLLLGCLAMAIHSMGDCPLRAPANLCSLLLALACLDGFIPHEERA